MCIIPLLARLLAMPFLALNRRRREPRGDPPILAREDLADPRQMSSSGGACESDRRSVQPTPLVTLMFSTLEKETFVFKGHVIERIGMSFFAGFARMTLFSLLEDQRR
jgi:hypothetical protein